MESTAYIQYLKNKEEEFEAVCSRCGECCGSLDDPCANLVKGEDGSFFCNDYHHRLGFQKTATGISFKCVPITERIYAGSLRNNCEYK